MPSFDHEALLELFRRRPTLAPELLRDVLHVPMPLYEHIEVGDSTLTELSPTERRADLVLVCSPSPGAPAQRVLVVEAQLRVDPEKRRSWWSYLVSAHTRHRCDAVLVVVTPSAAVAAWAAKPIPLGHPGVSLHPIVLGPASVPVVRDAAEATRSPELAVLSAMIHGRGDAAEDIARATFAAMRDLDAERVALYNDIALTSLRAAARAIFEDLMANGTYQYKSDFAKRYVAQGRTEGEARGEARGRAFAVLAFLNARGVEVSPTLRERVLACTDVALLDVWIGRAATAKEGGDVVGD